MIFLRAVSRGGEREWGLAYWHKTMGRKLKRAPWPNIKRGTPEGPSGGA